MALGILAEDPTLPAMRLSEHEYNPPASAPALGEHTAEILEGAGLPCGPDPCYESAGGYIGGAHGLTQLTPIYRLLPPPALVSIHQTRRLISA